MLRQAQRSPCLQSMRTISTMKRTLMEVDLSASRREDLHRILKARDLEISKTHRRGITVENCTRQRRIFPELLSVSQDDSVLATPAGRPCLSIPACTFQITLKIEVAYVAGDPRTMHHVRMASQKRNRQQSFRPATVLTPRRMD